LVCHHTHHDDAWVHYLRHPDLVPILDDLTWPEDIALFPEGYGLRRPWFQLLADSNAFFFFDIEVNALFQAGTTVEEADWWLKYISKVVVF